MSKITDIDTDDDVIKRLGKLVPVYTITILGFVSSIFLPLYNEGPIYAQIAIYITIGASLLLTIIIERLVREVESILQLFLVALSGALWIFLINLRFFDYPNIVILFIQFGIALYTGILGLLSALMK